MEDRYPSYGDLVDSQDRDFFDDDVNTQYIERIVEERNVMKANTNKFCSNKTLESDGEGIVIIVKPAENQARELINNPIELNRVITNSAFNKFKMKDIRINKRRKIIVMELQERNPEIIKQLLAVRKMGDIDITSYVPDKDRYKYGVIYPVSTKVTMEELLRKIQENEYNAQVMKVERMKKRQGSEFVDSESVKVAVEGERLPEGIRIERSYYKVRPFVFTPVQCYHCQ